MGKGEFSAQVFQSLTIRTAIITNVMIEENFLVVKYI